jgi:flagellar motility protein MotE (MotC chaperone)
MAEKKTEDQNNAAPEQAAETATPKKSGLMMYIIIGVGGIVLAMGVVVGILMFTKEKPADSQAIAGADSTAVATAHEKTASSHESTSKDKHKQTTKSSDVELSDADLASLDSTFPKDSSEILKEVADNLAYLDYHPSDNDLVDSQPIAMTPAESLEAVNWLEQEQKRLANKETDLVQREQQLNKLNSEVSKKITRIEQAETARIGTLAKMYDGMDPKSVAKLMADLDDETIVSILPRMKTANASSVLGLLPSPRAAKLSKQMITIADGDSK